MCACTCARTHTTCVHARSRAGLIRIGCRQAVQIWSPPWPTSGAWSSLSPTSSIHIQAYTYTRLRADALAVQPLPDMAVLNVGLPTPYHVLNREWGSFLSCYMPRQSYDALRASSRRRRVGLGAEGEGEGGCSPACSATGTTAALSTRSHACMHACSLHPCGLRPMHITSCCISIPSINSCLPHCCLLLAVCCPPHQVAPCCCPSLPCCCSSRGHGPPCL